MWNKILSWRYYTYEREQYSECMNNIFKNNLVSLQNASKIIAIFAVCFAVFPIVVELNFLKAGVVLGAALISFLFYLWANYKMQTANVNNRFIYILTILFYANLMLFSVSLSVWFFPEKLTPVFYCFYIGSLLMFVNPPLFNLCLTLGGMICFIVSAIINAPLHNLVFSIINIVLAGIVSMFFNLHITKLRLGLELSAVELEDERNRYFDQSTIDPLTLLKNRRDFMQTFHRYLFNFRTTDTWLCLGLIDIDFFKFYNDHYGHPMGDECLRSVGRALNSLKDTMGVYSARVGGEEFTLLWFEEDSPPRIDMVIAHLQQLIDELNIPHEKSKVSPHVTLSVGVYVLRCGMSDDEQAVYDLADKALYTAKEGGRNCAVITGDEVEQYKMSKGERV